MSSTTKRKYVTRDVMENFTLPAEDETIVQVLGGRGNNLHEVKTDLGETYLVSMPQKFRKNVWIKRGDFVVVKPIEEGDKVKAEILTILYKEQIKYIKAENLWPVGFEEKLSEQELVLKEDNSDDDSDLFKNTNRPSYQDSTSSEDSDSSDNDA